MDMSVVSPEFLLIDDSCRAVCVPVESLSDHRLVFSADSDFLPAWGGRGILLKTSVVDESIIIDLLDIGNC